MENSSCEIIDIKKNEELFEYEMTEVILMLKGEFAVFSGKDTKYAEVAVEDNKLQIKQTSLPIIEMEEKNIATPTINKVEIPNIPNASLTIKNTHIPQIVKIKPGAEHNIKSAYHTTKAHISLPNIPHPTVTIFSPCVINKKTIKTNSIPNNIYVKAFDRKPTALRKLNISTPKAPRVSVLPNIATAKLPRLTPKISAPAIGVTHVTFTLPVITAKQSKIDKESCSPIRPEFFGKQNSVSPAIIKRIKIDNIPTYDTKCANIKFNALQINKHNIDQKLLNNIRNFSNHSFTTYPYAENPKPSFSLDLPNLPDLSSSVKELHFTNQVSSVHTINVPKVDINLNFKPIVISNTTS